ncbi:cobalamin B12-binding domain-containing protein [Ideonella sp. 4Y16]|uniref:Cobalamin B12-binding domain-containing protein n=1 Tax=Ideonella alba TaxID=2824118 RepID=A0A940Y7R0_9BURK|nr:cobalamin B12-binding domain-containing protein [Ideonella alba]MBQ0930358.1 cobalamin B12-binding domain-containing protein [Ideonella alba]MBQ0943420.1 cobalamin B12-binding domain-containing protein [Ideonella alba]
MGSWNRGHAPPPTRLPAGEDTCHGVRADDLLCAHSAALLDTVEHQIIPRLMLLHRQHDSQASTSASGAGFSLDSHEVERFTEHVLQGYEQAMQHVIYLQDHGVPAPTLCLDLLAPAARRLGELWSADLCDFTQVTIGLGRLQGLLRSIAERLPPTVQATRLPRSALFAPAPGEQHTLGLSMVRDFFRASGWEVCADEPKAEAGLLALARSHRFDVIGFSIGSDRQTDPLKSLIARLRQEARYPLIVLLGGPLVLSRPELAQALGADAGATDARQALLVADALMTARDTNR